ncbi:DNA-binding transcriptional LysR family regulator [Paraburkholderia sp. GAS199]|uniref:LysR family transcriptional regulator n=1 Tax=Paraburkholderia sp. GAS199 TaxID=3035126 RepID=UPI003D1C9D72
MTNRADVGAKQMKLEDIHAFVAVVRHASVTGAAEMLLTRQPAITRRVQSLEKDLGVLLLDRNTKPSRPTPIGRRVFDLCMNVMRDVELIEDLLRADAPPSGRLRVGVAEILAELALFDALPVLREAFPQMELEVASGWSTEVIGQLREGTVDAAIAVLPESTRFDHGLSAESIGVLPMVVVAKKGSLPAHGRLSELQGHEWILSPEGCGFRDSLQRAFSDLGLPLAVRIATFGTEQKLGLVARGVGLGFVPENMLKASAFAPALQRIDLADFKPLPHVWRVHYENLGRAAPCVQRFGEAIVAGLSTPGRKKLDAARAPGLPHETRAIAPRGGRCT